MTKQLRRRRKRQIFLGNFYLNPSLQTLVTVGSAIVLAGLVFSGFLAFRLTDHEDLLARGKQQLRQGKVAWAKETFQKAVNRHPDSYQGHLLLGQAYLELDESRLAEREFRTAAALKSRFSNDHAPEIALSKVEMAKGRYEDAEKMLMQAYKKDRKNRELRQALYELYEHWGNRLYNDESKDFAAIVDRYLKALRYISNSESEELLKDRLADTIALYTDQLLVQKDYEKAIRLLKISLKFRYTPETLITIAESYERNDDLDGALEWYRRAFDANPQVISLRLTDVLLRKGRQLLDAKKAEEAKQYFDEADRITASAKIPLEKLYPVNISNVKIDFNLDRETGEMSPKVRMSFTNGAPRPINFLMARASFVSGDQELASATEVVATPEKPLPIKDDNRRKQNKHDVVLSLDQSLNLHALTDNKLVVKIYISYRDAQQGTEKPDDSRWKLKSVQETVIRDDSVSVEAKSV